MNLETIVLYAMDGIMIILMLVILALMPTIGVQMLKHGKDSDEPKDKED